MNLRRLTQTCSSRIKPTIGQRRASQQKIAGEGRDGSKTEAAARRGDVRFTPRNRTRVYEYTPYPRYQLQKRQSSCKDLAPQPGPPIPTPSLFSSRGWLGSNLGITRHAFIDSCIYRDLAHARTTCLAASII